MQHMAPPVPPTARTVPTPKPLLLAMQALLILGQTLTEGCKVANLLSVLVVIRKGVSHPLRAKLLT